MTTTCTTTTTMPAADSWGISLPLDPAAVDAIACATGTNPFVALTALALVATLAAIWGASILSRTF